MDATSWVPGVSADRRVSPDRRVTHSILNQETLASIVAETGGEYSYAGQALKELERRRAESGPGSGDDEIIICSLRGRWLVGTVREIRETMSVAAQGASRRQKDH